ncbi:MAG: L-lactate dehydrogenase [Alphaproteobacteria bacterium]|nr:L-lactate dehydrogenase [Alphaproteobacteria bacterium]
MKIGIIGTGNVGSATAYTLVVRNIAQEVVLIDYNPAKAVAEAEDILHATSVSYATKIRAGDYADLSGVDVVIITAGSNRKPGQTRTDLLEINAKIFAGIVPEIVKYAPNSIIIVASNPVDVMAHVAFELSGFPKERVISSGTLLDTARFQSILSKHLHIAPQFIDAHVLGEHGDSQTLVWSRLKSDKITPELMKKVDDEVRYGGKKIIEGKGATFYGIASCLARLCLAIKNDEDAILNVATFHAEADGAHNVFASYPTIINRKGAREVIYPRLSETEKEALQKSVQSIKENSEIALNVIK